MTVDPIEETPEYKLVVNEVEQEAHKTLADQGVQKTRGYIHQFWTLKKKMLKDKHSIDWKSPAEMNPNAKFD